MKRNNFFSNLVNFLAIWAGILVSIFLGLEMWKMIETFVVNIKDAFEYATGGWVVFVTMIISLIATGIIAMIKSFKGKE